MLKEKLPVPSDIVAPIEYIIHKRTKFSKQQVRFFFIIFFFYIFIFLSGLSNAGKKICTCFQDDTPISLVFETAVNKLTETLKKWANESLLYRFVFGLNNLRSKVIPFQYFLYFRAQQKQASGESKQGSVKLYKSKQMLSLKFKILFIQVRSSRDMSFVSNLIKSTKSWLQADLTDLVVFKMNCCTEV